MNASELTDEKVTVPRGEVEDMEREETACPQEQSTTGSAASLHTCQTRKVGFTA